MQYQEEDYLQMSGVQHYAYCKRQWALIHIEQLWSDNDRTVKGELFHSRVDKPNIKETRGNKQIVRSLHVSSSELGFSGICDVVEFNYDCKNGALSSIVPIEYKVGHNKICDCDRIQLCAEAIALEEMYSVHIATGFLYYGQERRRSEVQLDTTLRQLTMKVASEMHILFTEGKIPFEEQGAKCRKCSLFDVCMPPKDTYKEIEKYIEVNTR